MGHIGIKIKFSGFVHSVIWLRTADTEYKGKFIVGIIVNSNVKHRESMTIRYKGKFIVGIIVNSNVKHRESMTQWAFVNNSILNFLWIPKYKRWKFSF